MSDILVRVARAGEALALAVLSVRAKAHRGYDETFMRLSQASLTASDADDPNAVPFYERMGARFVTRAPSDAIPGRTLRLYEYDLAQKERS